MSSTERKPLARIVGGTVIDAHCDRRGTRTTTAHGVPGGVRISITHTDGRRFEYTIPCALIDSGRATCYS